MGLSPDVRAHSGHSSYDILEGFAGEFKLQLDYSQFYMREVMRKSESRRGHGDGPAEERTIDDSQTQANTTPLNPSHAIPLPSNVASALSNNSSNAIN